MSLFGSKNSEEPSRTRRARKSSLAGFLRTGVVAGIGILVTPYVQRVLGKNAYGSWLMLMQLVGYIVLIDIFPNSLLKYELAHRKSSTENVVKTQFIGFGLCSSLFSIPLFIAAAILLIFYGESIIGSPINGYSLKFPMALMALAGIQDKLVSVPEFAIIGENLEYKSTIIRTFMAISTGLLDVALVYLGFGLVGLALNRWLASLLNLLLLNLIARREVHWFGAKWAGFRQYFSFWRKGSWLILQQIGNTLIDNADIVLYGVLFGPSSAAVYALTSALMRMVVQLGNIGFNGLLPGFGELCGTGNPGAVENVKLQAELLLIIFWTGFATAVMAGNSGFVRLWVGEDRFGGNLMTAIVSITGLALLFGNLRMGMMLFSLRVAQTSFIRLISGIIGAVSAYSFGRIWGMPGCLSGFLIGRTLFVCLASSSFGVRGQFEQSRSEPGLVRALIVAIIVVFGIGLRLNETDPRTWASLVIVVSIAFISGAFLVWMFGLNQIRRRSIQTRLRASFLTKLPKLA
jgi:O-antigen/teichoic acid export membrane protein